MLFAVFLISHPITAQVQNGWTKNDSVRLSKMLDGEIPIHINDAFKKELEQSFTGSPMKNNSNKFNSFILGVKDENSLIKYPRSGFRNLHIQ